MIPIFSCECHEPEGVITRNVYSMNITQENLTTFWEKSRQYPTLFSSHINDDFNKFCNLFLYQKPDGSFGANGLFFVVDDFIGVFYITDIMMCGEATAHYTFFDRRHRGRVELTREMLKYAFKEFYFNRLNAVVPLYAKRQTHNFIERVGFIKEGRKRDAALYHNRLFDENIYGILRREILNEESNGSKN